MRSKTKLDLPPPPAQPSATEIRASRLAGGFTQGEMAAALGLSSYTRVAEYEAGRRNMPGTAWAYWLLINK